ncbi:MAG: hydroxysqualene dehydroxylase HpnE [Solirubrobacteraceae bacterium]
MRRVLVVGGGLAGITAALDCADAGARVTLVEVRRRLGGAAYSFERDGLEMDNGQHVFLRCCGEYRALLRRLGSERLVELQPRLRIPVLRPGRRPVVLERDSLPAPLHLARALACYRHLSPRERLGAVRAALALARVDPHDPASERETFGAWLQRHGQGRWAIAALWDLIALPTLNVSAAEASLALAAFVFRTGLLAGADAGDIGFHRGTLQQIIGEPAERALAEASVEVRLGWRAERLVRAQEGGQAAGPGAAGRPAAGFALEGGRGETLRADAAIVALPHNRAGGLIGELLPREAEGAGALGSSPIVNLHVVYDRPVLDVPFAAGVGTPVQYLFDRSAAAGAPPGCQYLVVSLSGADREMELTVPELRARFEPAIAELLPRAREGRIERFQVTREHAATFRGVPGAGALRARASTPIAGLALAGAWTDTQWPATLEGAVMSGHAAARAALGGK